MPKGKPRAKKAILGFCGGPVVKEDWREVWETGMLTLTWGGIEVSIPAESLKSLEPQYQYACVQWVVQSDGETLLYEVKQAGELEPEVEKLLKEHCIVSVGGGKKWLCTKPFFDKLYEKARKMIMP